MIRAIVLNVLAAAALSAVSFAQAPATAPAAAEKYTLKAKYNPGRYVLEQKADIVQTMTPEGGQPTRHDISQAMTITQAISPADKQGNQTVLLGFRSVQQKISSAGSPSIEYDSQGPPQQQHPLLGATLTPLLQARVTVIVGPDGRVRSVTGMDELWDRLAEQSPAMSAMLLGMKKSLGNNMIRETMEKTAQMLPDKPVAIGESWQNELKVDMPYLGARQANQDCTLKAVRTTADGHIAVIDVLSKIESSQPTQTDVGGAAVTVEKVEFTQKGEIRFNIERGMQESAQLDQAGHLIMTMPDPTTGKTARIAIDQEAKVQQKQQSDTQPPQTQPAPTTQLRPEG